MCLICIEYNKNKLTLDEAWKNLHEMYETIGEKHTWEVDYLVRYLKGTPDLGVKFTPDPTKSFECYADADYCCNWSNAFTEFDPSTAKS